MLKTKEVTYKEVSVFDLESWLESIGIPYSIIAGEEMRNDSVYRFYIEPEEPGTWERNKVQDAQAGKNPMYALKAILDTLCYVGRFEAGEYLVTVCW